MAIYRDKISEIVETDTDQFQIEVNQGLSDYPKHLSSKYFYDKKGDDLFVKITQLPEYYLTRAESEIISEQGDKIVEKLDIDGNECQVIELGVGDGQKSVQLLKNIGDYTNLTFVPTDISSNTLDIVQQRFLDIFTIDFRPCLNCIKLVLQHQELFGYCDRLGMLFLQIILKIVLSLL
jgi:uncharacterized SAM-dependent methyltransferase